LEVEEEPEKVDIDMVQIRVVLKLAGLKPNLKPSPKHANPSLDLKHTNLKDKY